MNTKRRGFLKAGTSASIGLGIPDIIPSSALGNDGRPAPSNRVVMAGIGLGNKGNGDQQDFLRHKEVQYVAVCDVRDKILNIAKNRTDSKYGNKDCEAYVDYREVISRDDIDAVHIATPDHWHAQMVIDACRHGKDVFCQKPETRTIEEGPLMVDAVHRYGRIFSGGSQRVMEDYSSVVMRCWGGHFGNVKSINVQVGPMSKACNLEPQSIPDDINWELWLGPAPWAPYNSNRCDGNFETSGNSWRSYSDYSGGGLTDWGAHHFGGATFALDVRDLQPEEIILQEDEGQKHITFKYPNGKQITHNRPRTGNMRVSGTNEKVDPKNEPIPVYADNDGKGGRGSIDGDFIQCVKTRKQPFRKIEHVINTMALPLFASIAYTVNRSLKWDSNKQEFIGDNEANRLTSVARREPWQL